MSNANQLKSAVEDIQQAMGVLRPKVASDDSSRLAMSILDSAAKRIEIVAKDLENSPQAALGSSLAGIQTFIANGAKLFEDRK